MSAILKWAGNKTAIMPELIKHLPAGPRLVEPFAGSCAVMMATDYPHYLVADINPDLINLYQVIKNDVEYFIKEGRYLFEARNDPEAYYKTRQEFNLRHGGAIERALYFLYLNRHGYRGLCRYTWTVILMFLTVIIKSRTSLKTKYVHLQKKQNAQRLSAPAMTRHWHCCKRVMLSIAIHHMTARLTDITQLVLQRMISSIWRLFLNAGHQKVIRLSCPTAIRL